MIYRIFDPVPHGAKGIATQVTLFLFALLDYKTIFYVFFLTSFRYSRVGKQFFSSPAM